jgi:dienelactone hydrolase
MVEEVYRQAAEIAADPQSTTKTAWGHTFKRWSSFFKLSPVEELKKSTARVYLAYGTADESVPVESNDLARAELFAAGRDVTCERIVGADHGYRKPGEQGYTTMDAVIGRVLEWFLAGGGAAAPAR